MIFTHCDTKIRLNKRKNHGVGIKSKKWGGQKKGGGGRSINMKEKKSQQIHLYMPSTTRLTVDD